LITARLAELVNARMEPTGWNCVYARAVPVSEKKGRQLRRPQYQGGKRTADDDGAQSQQSK